MPKKQVVQKNGHFYEIVGQQPIYKRIGDSVDQQKQMDALAAVKNSRTNRTGRGEIYKPLWNKDGSLKEGCAPYQKVNPATQRCVVKRSHVRDPETGKPTKKWKPLSENVQNQRKEAEQYYLTNGLSRAQKIAKAYKAIREAKDYLASDAYGHHINKDPREPGDRDQVWDASRKRWIVQQDKKCPTLNLADCAPGTFPPGMRSNQEIEYDDAPPVVSSRKSRKYRR